MITTHGLYLRQHKKKIRHIQQCVAQWFTIRGRRTTQGVAEFTARVPPIHPSFVACRIPVASLLVSSIIICYYFCDD
jgi:hypothetical protein